VNSFFSAFARRAAELTGSPWALTGVVVLVGLWVVTGIHFGFSAAWLAVFSASTSTASLIIVLLLQASQHRDTRAIQLKLNELLRAVETARTDLVHLEHRSDEELSAVQQEFAHVQAADYAGDARCNGDADTA
jgi:low affinity Fe/Cu permease